MALAPITQVLDAESVTGGAGPHSVDTDTVNIQNKTRTNQFHFAFSANPGSASGKMYLMAKLSEEASFAEVYEGGSRIEIDFSNAAAPNWTIAAHGVQSFVKQFWRTTNLNLNNTRTLDAYIIE